MEITHHIFYNGSAYFNVCASHHYVVSTEYHKDLGSLLFSLHDMYDIFYHDEFPQKEDSAINALYEALHENEGSEYIVTVTYNKHFISRRYKALKKAYRQVVKGYLKKDVFFFDKTKINIGDARLLVNCAYAMEVTKND